jgi:hypothetical protein
LNLRRFGSYDRKSRRAQLSIRHGDRNYDRSVVDVDTGKAQRYFASDFDRLSSRLFDANGIAAVSRKWRLAPRYCTRSANTALQYWTERRRITQKLPDCFNQLKRNENVLVLSRGLFVGPKIDWTDLNYKAK